MKTISNVLNTSELSEGYFLTVETFNREKFYLTLNDEELRVISRFATSGTPRNEVLKNFINSISDQPENK